MSLPENQNPADATAPAAVNPQSGTPGPSTSDRVFSSPRPGGQGMPRMAGGVVDRRLGLDRRDIQAAVAGRVGGQSEPPISGTGMDRRRGRGRRLSDFTKSAEEGQMTQEQFLFLMAIDAFKKANAKQFPSWSDVLEVIRLLGYRKTMPMELTLRAAEDWKEAADAPSNVRTERQVRRARGEAA